MNKPRLNIIQISTEKVNINTIKYGHQKYLHLELEEEESSDRHLKFKTVFHDRGNTEKKGNTFFRALKWFFIVVLVLILLGGIISKELAQSLIVMTLSTFIISIFLTLNTWYVQKKYPGRLHIIDYRILFWNDKGKVLMDFYLNTVQYINIVSRNAQKIICFSAQNDTDGEVLINSPVFDISSKEAQQYLLDVLEHLNTKFYLHLQKREFKIQ